MVEITFYNFMEIWITYILKSIEDYKLIKIKSIEDYKLIKYKVHRRL